MPTKLNCFKAYDIRGKVPEELNENIAFRIGQAFYGRFAPKSVAIGHDIRLTGPGLASALTAGFRKAGVNVIDIGMCGTEEIYFASSHLEVDGAIIITASHNPAGYNGMKFVRKGGVPISGDSGLHDIERMVTENFSYTASKEGTLQHQNPRSAYVSHLLSYIDSQRQSPLKIVVNAGNGSAGAIIDLLEEMLPFSFIKLQHTPDGSFPNGVPNPLLPENRDLTSTAVIDHNADLGIAWDGDFDRCFFFDENGRFIEGYYMVALLAKAMLKLHPHSKIIHDPRLTWNTIEEVHSAGGTPVVCKTGHAFIKERMRSEDAIYGGEMSAHHYFKDFSYCDSGMIPWLLICDILAKTNKPLSHLVNKQMEAFPVSGEINRRVENPARSIQRVREQCSQGGKIEDIDGLSVSFANYRFNIRESNTEPVLRLNVESRGDKQLMERVTNEILALLDN